MMTDPKPGWSGLSDVVRESTPRPTDSYVVAVHDGANIVTIKSVEGEVWVHALGWEPVKLTVDDARRVSSRLLAVAAHAENHTDEVDR